MSLSLNYPAIRPALLLDFAKTQVLDPRITFTRASPAVYYDGVTDAVAEQNLLTYSQDFNDVAWSKQNATVTANSTAAPNGTTTADTLIDDSANTWHIAYRNITVTSGAYTVSAYLKANTATFGAVSANWAAQANGYGVVVNLTTGALGSELVWGTGAGTYAISSVGNGWYRVAITVNATANVYSLISVSNSATPTNSYALPTYIGTGSSIYIWGAQVEQRSVVTTYTPTTTQPITNYIPVLLTASAEQARFEHDPVTGESLGLLIESARTNQLLWSESFTDVLWLTNQLTINPVATVAPDGTVTANKIIATTGSLGHFIYQDSTTVVSSAYTQTIYAKAGEYSVLQITSSTGFTGASVSYQNYNLDTGTLGDSVAGAGQTASITAVGNGWYRCSYTDTATATTARFAIAITGGSVGRLPAFTGNGYFGLYLWGAQLEVGAFATSYIATTTVTVPRSADTAVVTGTNFSSWYNPGEGTLIAQGTTATTGVTEAILAELQTTSTDRMMLFKSTAATLTRVLVTVGSATQYDTTATALVNGTVFMGMAYVANDIRGVFNGSLGTADNGASAIPVVDRLSIGNQSLAFYWNGTIDKIAYYSERITDTQLQALTRT